MDLVLLISELIGTPLQPTEVDCLRHLSPAGVAKLNQDLSRGILPAQTLHELSQAFCFAQAWRKQILAALPAEYLLLLASATGQSQAPALSAEIIVFLTDCWRMGVPLTQLIHATRGSAQWRDEFADRADGYFHNLLDRDAAQLALHSCRLVPTEWPAKSLSSFDQITAPYFIHPQTQHNGKNAFVYQLSPVVSWFDESACQLLVSQDAAECVLRACTPKQAELVQKPKSELGRKTVRFHCSGNSARESIDIESWNSSTSSLASETESKAPVVFGIATNSQHRTGNLTSIFTSTVAKLCRTGQKLFAA